MGWKPIDEAPHDGAEIVVAFRLQATDAITVAVSAFKGDHWSREGDDILAAGDVPFAWIEKPQ